MYNETELEFMHRMLDTIENIAQRQFPGDLLHHGLFHNHDAPTRIFGIQGRNSVTRIFATVNGREGQGWWVNVNVGLGFEIGNVDSALRWVNQRNLQSTSGRYYVGVAHHGEWCSVMWENNIWCGLLEGLDGPGRDIIADYLQGALVVARQEADSTPYAVREYLGGRACPPGEQGMHWIAGNVY